MSEQPDGQALRRKVEAENEALTRRFNDAWSRMDVEGIVACIADDVVYMIHEGGRTLNGKEEVRSTLTGFMKMWSKIEFRILELHVMGPLVIHERTEYYTARDGRPDWSFWIAGLLVVKDGKIVIWRDYSMPGKKQISSPMKPPGKP